MTDINRQSFEKSWDYERFARLYQATSDALEWVEDRAACARTGDRAETQICLAVIEEDLHTLVDEFENRLFEFETASPDMISRAFCVLEEVNRIRRSEMRGKLVPFRKAP